MPEIIRINGSPDVCARRFKGLLGEIGSISGFEVYAEPPNRYEGITNYTLDEGDVVQIPSSYGLILKCDEGNQEVWIEGAACGYSGSGASCTAEVLQMLGVRMNYRRINEEEKIIMNEVRSEHKLNFIVRKCDSITEEEEIVLKTQLEFETPHDRITAFDYIELFGELTSIESSSQYSHREEYYFRESYSAVEGKTKYGTNQILTLGYDFVAFDAKALEVIFKNIAERFNAKSTKIIIYNQNK